MLICWHSCAARASGIALLPSNYSPVWSKFSMYSLENRSSSQVAERASAGAAAPQFVAQGARAIQLLPAAAPKRCRRFPKRITATLTPSRTSQFPEMRLGLCRMPLTDSGALTLSSTTPGQAPHCRSTWPLLKKLGRQCDT